MSGTATIQGELDRIARELLAEARRDAQGLYWLTPSEEANATAAREVDESLFSGTTGIVLFFAALSQQTSNSIYRQVAEEGTQWLIVYARTHEPPHVSFFSGRMGIVYLCCKLYALTNDAHYLTQGQQIAETVRAQLLVGNNSPDLLGGEAGNLLVLTYLYQLTDNTAWLPVLDAGLKRLVQHAVPSKQGLKWGYKATALDSLTGLSHGASGIGYVLLELGRCFTSNAFYWLADQAFLYEATYYRKLLHNWLNVRVHAEFLHDVATLQLPQAALLIGRGNLTSWAHGTAGIGLARLHAFEAHPLMRYQKEAQAALSKVLTAVARLHGQVDYTLSSGVGGLAELLLAAANSQPDATLLVQARQLARKAVRQRQQLGYYSSKNGEPVGPGLLDGLAGIGYFLLRTLYPEQVNSILAPRLPLNQTKRACPTRKYGYGWQDSVAALRQRIWGAHFVRTLSLLAQIEPAATAGLFRDELFPANSAELLTLQAQLHQLVQALPSAIKPRVAEAFRLEKYRVALLLRRPGFIYQAVNQRKRQAQAEKAATLTDAAFLLLSFRVAPRVRMLANRWNWVATQPDGWLHNLQAPASWYPVALVLRTDFIQEYALQSFPATLLRALRRPTTVASVITVLSQEVEQPAETGVLATLTTAVITQLKHFAFEGLVELVSLTD